MNFSRRGSFAETVRSWDPMRMISSNMPEQLNLFQSIDQMSAREKAPLAERMRPVSLEEFVGQEHLVNPGKLIHRMIKNNQMQSLILWGPPGCGKTTLARIIAGQTQAHLVALSAVMTGASEIRAATDQARARWAKGKTRTWLFLDEIHRLNKAQQDLLLPHVENGTFYLLGATTENPSFEVIRPLLSRAQVLVLEPLGLSHLERILERALNDRGRGLGNASAVLTGEAKEYLLAATGGDARVVLNCLEVAVLTTPAGKGEKEGRVIDLETLKASLHRSAVHYDKGGEEHFNLISALHKSIRGSDPDAALYWLARMLHGGEDPIYIARRLMRMASEDVGLADPFALLEVNAALQAYQLMGSPEGELALAQAAVYLALAPKSNALYKAFGHARSVASQTGALPVPLHLRNAPTGLMKNQGYGRDYQYPHDHASGWIPERYFPDSMETEYFYDPVPRGWEGKYRDLIAQRRRAVESKKKNKAP